MSRPSGAFSKGKPSIKKVQLDSSEASSSKPPKSEETRAPLIIKVQKYLKSLESVATLKGTAESDIPPECVYYLELFGNRTSHLQGLEGKGVGLSTPFEKIIPNIQDISGAFRDGVHYPIIELAKRSTLAFSVLGNNLGAISGATKILIDGFTALKTAVVDQVPNYRGKLISELSAPSVTSENLLAYVFRGVESTGFNALSETDGLRMVDNIEILRVLLYEVRDTAFILQRMFLNYANIQLIITRSKQMMSSKLVGRLIVEPERSGDLDMAEFD